MCQEVLLTTLSLDNKVVAKEIIKYDTQYDAYFDKIINIAHSRADWINSFV